jgi:nicotinamidase-related amidase
MATEMDTFYDQRPTEAIRIELAKTAVLVVDMQNDFGAKGGMFDRAGIDISPIQHVVAPTGRVLAAARKAGMKVIYLKMEHRPGSRAQLAQLGGDLGHAVGGVLVLLVITVLNVYKPRGLTPYGWRKQEESRTALLTRSLTRSRAEAFDPASPPSPEFARDR